MYITTVILRLTGYLRGLRKRPILLRMIGQNYEPRSVVDTPDLDSFVVEHRALTKALLKAAGLVVYVFSPEKYLEERTWSVLREEQAFSASVAVLNKVDLVRVPEERELVIADIRRRFADSGTQRHSHFSDQCACPPCPCCWTR